MYSTLCGWPFAGRKCPLSRNAFYPHPSVLQTSLSYRPNTAADFAGLAVFQDENCHICFGKTTDASGKPVLLLRAKSEGEVKVARTYEIPEAEASESVELRVSTDGNADYVFACRFPGEADWTVLGEPVDAAWLSNVTAGGFTGVVIGVYATDKMKQ